jgi:predicted transcriptional regulator
MAAEKFSTQGSKMTAPAPESDLLTLATQIVSAHVANNSVALDQLPLLIKDVYRTLASLGHAMPAEEIAKPTPAVPIKKSIFPEYIICLEDGKKLKMLKRHLQTSYGMTPDQYRERWGLAADYPMVAPNYASHRSSLAKKIGLGTSGARKSTT